MKLNPDCVRDILIYIEDTTGPNNNCISMERIEVNLSSYDPVILRYHVKMLSKRNLIEKVCYADNKPIIVSQLTPQGQDYTEIIRDTSIWKRVKTKLSGAIEITIPILLETAMNSIIK